MTREHWQQVKQIFEAVLDTPEQDRVSSVEAMAADPEIAREVLRLLHADRVAEGSFLKAVTQDAEAFLDRAASFLATEETQWIEAGTVLAARYEVVRELARGGGGVVYLAQDRVLHNRRVVVKFLFRDFEGRLTRKFQQEVEALARIRHPGVVEALDAGRTDGGLVFLVMEYVEGVTLRAIMTEPLDPERVVNLVSQIADALHAAHGAGVLHRDLKPENIMLQRGSSGKEAIKLIDFGIARIEDSAVSGTMTSMVAGTVDYMAPEQLMGQTSVATDVFSLAVVAYEMLASRRPFEPKTPFALFELQKLGRVERLGDTRRELPRALDATIRRALSFDPSKRPATAEDFGRGLSAAMEGGPASQRFRVPFLLAAVAALSCAMVAGAITARQPVAMKLICAATPSMSWCAANTAGTPKQPQHPAAPPLASSIPDADGRSLKLRSPVGLVRESNGNLYVSEYANHLIRRIAPDGRSSVIAGTGVQGYSGNDGPATLAQLHFPRALALDGDRYLYFSEPLIFRIRRIDLTTGIVTLAMGDGKARFSGDGLPGPATSIGEVLGMAVDREGNLLVSDTGNQTIRKLNARDGKVSTLAGTGTIGQSPDGTLAVNGWLNRPAALALHPDGDLYLSDLGNWVIQKIHAGIITTVAGNPRTTALAGPARNVLISACTGMMVDAAGKGLYFSDEESETIRYLDFASSQITIVAGSGKKGFAPDGRKARGALVGNPTYLALSPEGLIFAETFNNRIRRIDRSGILVTIAGTSSLTTDH